MTLREYYEGFHRYVTGRDGVFTHPAAADVAAAHELGLTFEQLQRFFALRLSISNVTRALKNPSVPVETIERIQAAQASGAVYPKDVLSKAFSRDEVHEQFHMDIFGDRE
jgi:hypothetical protein